MKHEEIDARLYDLMDQKAFHELNKDEKSFVLSQMSEEAYSFQRSLLESTSELEYPNPAPLPLFNQKPTVVWYKRPIPLYQVLAAAAVLLLFFTMFMKLETNGQSPNRTIAQKQPEPMIQVIYDTIVREVPVVRSSIAVIHDTVTYLQTVYTQTSIDRLLNVPREFSSIPLHEVVASTQVTSFNDDKTTKLLSSSLQSEKLSGK